MIVCRALDRRGEGTRLTTMKVIQRMQRHGLDLTLNQPIIPRARV